MPYLVLKGKGFWRERSAVVLRSVKTFRLFGFRRIFKSERYIRKRAVLVFEGEAHTGKTRELLKLCGKAKDIFGSEGVYISCVEGLESWFKRAGLEDKELKGLKQFEKVQKMVEKVRGKVVCLDDIDKVDSKLKVQVIKWLIRASGVAVVSCSNWKLVNPALVEAMREKLKLKPWQEIEKIDLGRTEIKDVGMVLAIALVVFVALTWGFTHALIGALALKWLVMEGRKK